MLKTHSFHIPVMGIGFTIDSPLKVSRFGIDSVISLVDDILLEKIRKMYSLKFKIPYDEITEKMDDFRAERVTSYLNLIKSLSEEKFEEFKKNITQTKQDIVDFFEDLPDSSSLKQEFVKVTSSNFDVKKVTDWLKENLSMGQIDVNIMTKVDKDNYTKTDKLAIEYNDAHAALRGFAKSDVNSSVVFSAGMNPRLYAYLENFKGFYPDKNGHINKKIILKVSDYRSALIQGKFLAKKGIWVSEYRIESGLNCGGHAFATDGYLLGPVLEEFKIKRAELQESIQSLLFSALDKKEYVVPETDLTFKISAQGGVGTADEHQFLLNHYNIDSVGWGTPFLLVPEATTVDKNTLNKLIKATEKDVYLSDISPLGVPFYNLKGNTKDLEKQSFIDKGRPGSACPKKFIALNKEFNEKGVCTASRQFQHLKIKELTAKNLSKEAYYKEYSKIIAKSCTCVGLGTSALLAYGLDTKTEGAGVSICPSPNIAYFSKKMSLKEITKTIYGQSASVTSLERPNLFIKELTIYIDYLKDKLKETPADASPKEIKYLKTFVKNLKEGLLYYKNLFNTEYQSAILHYPAVLADLELSSQNINKVALAIEKL
ncbi:hypothetical protein J2Q11_05500 [Tenacibaculum finnmarkense genomovar finnmarkense]|uniref:hypothetical protein n=1 Tax=Tenacibaculum finnmarkense TaxID=2781243 RepID=UPI001E49E238|nr:hypothetical protein [Tenacibaculum finnmarkense]MCD8416973.1 hypothetical protein [Tenacibaculum finnmarkense genomovar finnmarkense]MCG8201772.1 hypothetical protein [Tenacibaculum finnmarkense genomovar finnmarkense]MCG8209479.1 hypothetical protein [Tenacibaculum finnmarkense genomovar finnmarkense]MCG8212275.1 hypothetical protein [Tenacibaculum finnmarkense genomovar finnmarkense]MCG8219487.1 hypothetical protein [Tenacibaculum finnmarkense genomovar finnmarkense]